MNILAIETSCDETAAAIVKDGQKVVSSIIHSQIPVHKQYNGVVPELASRAHVQSIHDVIQLAWKNKQNKIDAIAVTVGPGLAGSLLVGRMAAQTLGWLEEIPVVGVNHIEGHFLSPMIEHKKLEPPMLGLIVSGGHTELIISTRWGRYEKIGQTRDDAAGEAFDKVSKMLGWGYPGGPIIERMARTVARIKTLFPIPWLHGTWDFSFSGLKTAVLYKLREKKRWSHTEKCQIAAGFQQSVIEVLVGKTLKAAQSFHVSRVIVGGGVAANRALREAFQTAEKRYGVKALFPHPKLCTDNAAMIGAAAYIKLKHSRKSQGLQIQPHLNIPKIKSRTYQFS